MGIGRTNSGGGVNVSGVTATAVDVHPDKYFVDSNGVLTQGAMPLLAGATYDTSTSNRTIAAGQYISSDQTIRAVTTSNITDANIKRGVTVKVGDSADAGRIVSVAGKLDPCNEAAGTVVGSNANALSIPAPTGWRSSSTIISLYIFNPTSNSAILMCCGAGTGTTAGRCVVNGSVYSCQIRNVSYNSTYYPVVNAPSDNVWSSNTTFTYKLIWR